MTRWWCSAVAVSVVSLAVPMWAAAMDAGPGGATDGGATDGGVAAWARDGGAGTAGGDAGPSGPGQSSDGGVDPGVVLPDDLPPGFVPPEAIASPGVDEVQLGRPFSLFISVTHPAGVRVNLPTMIPSLRGAFDELRRTSGNTKRVDGTPVQEFELEVIPWVVGDLRIPPIELTYVVNGKVHRIRTKAVPVKVISVIGEGEEKLRDIVPPVQVRRRDWFLLYLLGGFGVVLVGGLAAWRLRRVVWRPRRRRRQPAPAAVSLSADAEALMHLDQLEASGALDADDRKPAYVELSHIVRRYLSRRFGFPALELTTSEIKYRLAHVPGGDMALALMDDMLETADYAKYAGYASDPEEARAVVQRARGLVDGTRYVAPPAAPAPAATPALAHPVPAALAQPPRTDTLVDNAAGVRAVMTHPAANAPSPVVDTSATLIDSSGPPAAAPMTVVPDAAAPPTLVDTPAQTLKWPALPGDDEGSDA